MLETPKGPLRLHRFAMSGHCHRVELFLSLLELPFERVDVDLAAGEQKTPRFLSLNPLGQVPVVEDGELTLADSNAILTYLSLRYGGSRFTPSAPAELGEQQRWFSLAAGPLAFGPAAARAHALFGSPVDLPAAQARAHALFRFMNAHLSRRSFLVGTALGLADVAHYAYVAHAPEGGVSLDEYAHVRAWLRRVEGTPRFVGMPRASQRS
jgi:glutathione S-transferase